ncbi:MAG TPA: winged helix-turn-helix domain-containing protein, partial [Gemmatimonadaceae bacterium]|nr:winged helix-turn-helix domain-containing protein [Gemmatimonadaceae bacterium]
SRHYDLLILDIMLPRRTGWEILEALRTGGVRVPVICLTARDTVEDRVRGLELGADDYVVKPFAFAELLARVRSALRRGPTVERGVERVGDLEIDFIRQRATRQGKALDLTPREFALLGLLVRRRGEPLDRREIATQVWGMPGDSDSNAIDVAIRRLRGKVDDPFSRRLIRTVRGIGYVLESDP